MKTYYKLTCSREQEMAGAGLGYEEIFGNAVRYHWHRDCAQAALEQCIMECSDDLTNTYGIEERKVYEDGSWDDEGDQHAREQLEMDHAESR